MRVKPGFVLQEIAGEYFAIPFDSAYEAQESMVSLNQSGAFLWQQLEEECDEESLRGALEKTYQIESELAQKAVEEFLVQLRGKQLLIEP